MAGADRTGDASYAPLETRVVAFDPAKADSIFRARQSAVEDWLHRSLKRR